MTRMLNKRQDARTRKIYAALKLTFPNLPPLADTVYVYNPVAIRLRVIDERFEGKDFVEREIIIKQALNTLPREVTEDITLLVTVTPEEAAEPGIHYQAFDDPSLDF